ncbi:IS607 family transposase [Vreelandella andesensis]|uniref:IS607 family transposase n=1 Tax=Vreelandella andesensis TaxID=447567 RepID=A0A433KJK4_9GAMM|nr:IS607 family transposase [Halomonas andesensis]RUR29773.1 IS607 family transposase [Halomonas andesensis]
MYAIGTFAKMLGKSVKTLQRWDRDGILVVHRHAKGRRYYTHDQYLAYIGVKAEAATGDTVVYTRVSSSAQKPDLANQVAALETFSAASGYAVSSWVSEVGSGLNYKREKFNQLMIDIESGKVSRLVIAHKDRLVRFGYEWFEQFAERHGCTIVVMNHESLSPTEEVTQDLLTIINCFSSRLYGLRKYKKKVAALISAEDDAL